jgi:hypothetical protein
MLHELKTDPEVFDAVAERRKTHEIRYNDRGFAVGDTLVLRKTRFTGDQMREHGWPLDYVGKPLYRTVTHVLEGYGLLPGWVILSIKRTDQDIYAEIAAGVNACPDADAILRELVASSEAIDASLSNFNDADDDAIQDRHRAAWERAKQYVSGVSGTSLRGTDE